MNIFNIERAFKQKKERNWSHLYWCVDLHDTVIEGKYNLHNEGAEFYPGAIRVLQHLTGRPDHKLILWTSSHDISVKEVLVRMEKQGIRFDYVNENPECPSTELCDFSKKLYFNILLDDKAGFDGSSDWLFIEDKLKRLGQWTE